MKDSEKIGIIMAIVMIIGFYRKNYYVCLYIVRRNKMKKEDCELHIASKYPGWDVKISSSFQIPKQVVIETDHIYIKHKDLGIAIDVDTEQIEELRRITINGVSFIREN